MFLSKTPLRIFNLTLGLLQRLKKQNEQFHNISVQDISEDLSFDFSTSSEALE